MVYCKTHNRYHKGVSAKGACMLSVLKNKDYNEMFGKVKNMKDLKRIGFFEDVREKWKVYNDYKSSAENDMLSRYRKINNNTLHLIMKGTVEVSY